MKKGFTLAETMIVLTVIAIIAGIILPVAFKAKPDEDLARFKKYDAVIETAIKTLATSDEYFMSGNMTLTPDGKSYSNECRFANALAETLNGKVIACTQGKEYSQSSCASFETSKNCGYTNSSDFATFKNNIDTEFLFHNNILYKVEKTLGGETVALALKDNVTIIATMPSSGICQNDEGKRIFIHGDEGNPVCHDENNFDTAYGYISFVLGRSSDWENASRSTEELNLLDYRYAFQLYNSLQSGSFNYAFTADGKLIAGNKVEEWRAKEL